MASAHAQNTSQTFSTRHWLATHGADLVRTMFPAGDEPGDFGIKTLVQTHERLVLRVNAGETVALLKAFNPDYPRAVMARYREIALIATLQNCDLIPPLLGYSQKSNWILSHFIEGEDLEDLLTPDTAVDFARKLGNWYARFTDRVIRQAAEEDSDWLAYLGEYEPIKRVGLNPPQRALLQSLPMRQRVVAKNDSYFRNFLVDEDGTLFGIDFEKAELKPYGYDILVTARLLVRMFPNMLLELTEALVEGWGRGTDMIGQDALLELTRLFAATTAFSVTHEDDLRLRARLRHYNAQARQKAAAIHETPFMPQDLVAQTPAARARFVEGLERLITLPDAADGEDRPDQIHVKTENTERVLLAPSPAEAELCGLCKGACCSQGAANNAFLSTETLTRTRDALGLASLSETIRHYADLMPEQHVSGSCYFHGAEGCTIPREQRSDVCNAHRCFALRSFRATATSGPADKPILVLARSEDRVERAKLMQGDHATDIDPALLETSPVYE